MKIVHTHAVAPQLTFQDCEKHAEIHHLILIPKNEVTVKLITKIDFQNAAKSLK